MNSVWTLSNKIPVYEKFSIKTQKFGNDKLLFLVSEFFRNVGMNNIFINFCSSIFEKNHYLQ